jgi:hypothetical protein
MELDGIIGIAVASSIVCNKKVKKQSYTNDVLSSEPSNVLVHSSTPSNDRVSSGAPVPPFEESSFLGNQSKSKMRWKQKKMINKHKEEAYYAQNDAFW